MSQQTYNFPDHPKGDEFAGVQFNLTVNAALVDLTGATIKMQLKESTNSTAVAALTLDTGAGNGIVLTDPVNGQFEVAVDRVIDIPAKCYFYDIQITFPSGSVKTYIKGQWTILPEVTT